MPRARADSTLDAEVDVDLSKCKKMFLYSSHHNRLNGTTQVWVYQGKVVRAVSQEDNVVRRCSTTSSQSSTSPSPVSSP